MGKKIESILSDYWIIFLSTCGLIFIAISTYTLFRPKILADDEVINQIEDLNNENEGNVELRRTPRVKEKDHLKKKELFRLARLKAKQDLSQYKEACKESQLSNRRNVVGQGMDMEYDVTVDDILKYFNASTESSLTSLDYLVKYIFPIPKADLYKVLCSLSVKDHKDCIFDMECDFNSRGDTNCLVDVSRTKSLIRGAFIRYPRGLGRPSEYGSEINGNTTLDASLPVSINEIPIPLHLDLSADPTISNSNDLSCCCDDDSTTFLFLHLTEKHVENMMNLIEMHHGCLSASQLELDLKKGLRLYI